ncbi:putative 4-coumarate--CoA ligase 5-like [Tropilaelaps mercedesae]|uniref:Putative 4-coumarate--CoA ligase 5-like n=1 Tax=Tropilaelaps mercedesae TaxID=418985 RepID=A0A1V9X8I0_9ACAR|nr:putative 4-coumarate--CoA ligase 5-like [Tropilaelaps mercedesae]
MTVVLERTLDRFHRRGRRHNASKTAIVDVLRGRELTSGELEQTVRRVAGKFQKVGLRSNVQFYADNSLPAVVALQAAFFNNATVLLLSPDETVKRDEYGFQTKEAEVEYIITDSKNFNLMLEKVLLIDGSLPPGEHARVALINELPDGAYVEPAVRIKKDVLILLYTSGSTGLPKGVMHSHYNYVTSLQIMHHLGWCETYDRVLVASSLTYVSGLILHGGSLAYGATLLLASSVIEVDYPRYAELYKPTISLLLEVPARNIVTNSSRYRNAVEMVSTFRLMLISGTVFPEKLRISVQKLFTNVNFVQLYGMTEAIGAIVASDPQPVIPISAGYAVPNVIIRVLNESGKPVKVGAQKTLGYWKRMADDCTEDGLYPTGDIGVIDEDGQLNLLGRNKQFIICFDSPSIVHEDRECSP